MKMVDSYIDLYSTCILPDYTSDDDVHYVRDVCYRVLEFALGKLRHDLSIISKYGLVSCEFECVVAVRSGGICAIISHAKTHLKNVFTRLGMPNEHSSVDYYIEKLLGHLRTKWMERRVNPNFPLDGNIPSGYYHFKHAVESGEEWEMVRSYAAARIGLIDEAMELIVRFRREP